MMFIYVLTCNRWGGTSYNKENVEAFYSHDAAERWRKIYQGNISKCDVEYEVDKVEIEEKII